jgi:GT2 family glycosyltransferase
MYNSCSIAVLITCHNRREKTINCLNHLFSSQNRSEFDFDVFLVDDGSTDGTSEAISKQYPKVNIIKGNGELYWNQGMRLAWKTSIEIKRYEFYILLNDDTMIDEDGIYHLFDCYYEKFKETKIENIVAGFCRDNVGNSFSYGGKMDNINITPNGEIQNCKYINGNFVLVPNKIVESIGILSNAYTHAMGDYDYGLMALNKGFHLITTRKYVALCHLNGIMQHIF